ncbi:hypothetical protein K438DRAFT_1808008, partial [Mycena galopus ATCC 62051]
MPRCPVRTSYSLQDSALQCDYITYIKELSTTCNDCGGGASFSAAVHVLNGNGKYHKTR